MLKLATKVNINTQALMKSGQTFIEHTVEMIVNEFKKKKNMKKK